MDAKKEIDRQLQALKEAAQAAGNRLPADISLLALATRNYWKKSIFIRAFTECREKKEQP